MGCRLAQSGIMRAGGWELAGSENSVEPEPACSDGQPDPESVSCGYGDDIQTLRFRNRYPLASRVLRRVKFPLTGW